MDNKLIYKDTIAVFASEQDYITVLLLIERMREDWKLSLEEEVSKAYKAGHVDGREDSQLLLKQVTELRESVNNLQLELQMTESILDNRTRVLKAIPSCAVHGDSCVEHAIDWVNRMNTIIENIRWSIYE